MACRRVFGSPPGDIHVTEDQLVSRRYGCGTAQSGPGMLAVIV